MVYSSASVAEMLVLQDLHELCGFWNFQLEIFLSSGEVMVGRYWCHSGFFWKRGPGLNNWQIPVLQVSFRPSPSRVPQRAVESRRLERKDVILKAKQGSRFWNVIMWSLIAQKMLQGLQITTCLLLKPFLYFEHGCLFVSFSKFVEKNCNLNVQNEGGKGGGGMGRKGQRLAFFAMLKSWRLLSMVTIDWPNKQTNNRPILE